MTGAALVLATGMALVRSQSAADAAGSSVAAAAARASAVGPSLGVPSAARAVVGAVPRTASARDGAPTPEALARRVLERFVAGDPEAFDSVYPDVAGRDLVRAAAGAGLPLRPGEARVLAADERRALLFLAGYAELGNTGDETVFSRGFSGLHEAGRGDGGWQIVRRLPIDADNRIRAHTIDATIEPGRGLRVRDELELDVGSPQGFWAFLNRGARIDGVALDGEPVEHVFAAGLLWVRAPSAGRVRLVLDYYVDVARDSAAGPNSGRFEADYGHVRNQYFWHPFFDFNSEADRARFDITVRAPPDVRVATGVPHTYTRIDGARLVHARSERPTFALTLLYDRGWTPVTRRFGGLHADLLVTSDFEPSAGELAVAVERTHRVLSARFGEPASRYLLVAQGRARRSRGWHFRSNDMIVGGAEGAAISRAGALPRAWLGHEVAHGWTRPTGAGANLLSEGWASFAETLVLEDEYGAGAAAAFWESYRNWYLRDGFDGSASIVNDPNNGGIAYSKGGWIFRMLHDVLGDSAFDAGLRAYMRIPPDRPAGIEEFTASLSAAAGRDVTPLLRPWLEEAVIPDVRTRVEDGRVVLTQHGPTFRLPLELELETPAGPVRRRVELSRPEQTLDVGDLGPVLDVRVDPDHRLLIRRRRGEVVRFELPSAADAEQVRLEGDFASQPIDAVRENGVWVVEVPMTEGRYAFWWRVDGEYFTDAGNGVRRVRPIAELADAYPR